MYARTTGLIVGLLGCLLVIGVPAASAKKAHDRNHDRIADRWERAHHLTLRVNQARRDQDRDGVKNLAEFRARMNPRDADSDDDGVEDGDEQAGRVTAFENGLLTIDVFGTGPITGRVTAETEIECDGSDDTLGPIRAFRHDEGDDEGDDEDGDNNEGEHGKKDDGDSESDDDGEVDDQDCPADALKVGAIVQEADLKIAAGGAVFEEIELLVQ
jgi:hypothetical protein